MIVTCLNCSTRLQLDEAKVPARPFSVRCPKCQQIVNAQPPAAQAADALAAVGDLPASTRLQQEAGVAHAAPLQNADAEEVSVVQAQGESSDGELLRLLASLLRREAGVAASSAQDEGRSGWGRRRAVVCMGSAYGGDAARSLSKAGYKVFAATDTTQAVERMREDGVDVLVLDPEFDMGKQGAGFITREVGSMRMADRRRMVFVTLSGAARTGDAHEAFLAGANLVVKVTDANDLPRVLEKNIRDLNDLYRDFNKAMGMAEL